METGFLGGLPAPEEDGEAEAEEEEEAEAATEERVVAPLSRRRSKRDFASALRPMAHFEGDAALR